MYKLLERLKGALFNRPYRLAKVVDVGQGTPVILLHGIGKTGQVWRHVIKLLDSQPYRLVAFDLLGFGRSPRPSDIDYTIDDHARAVIASIKGLALTEPPVIIGHSMGSLIAVRLARLRPDLVRHLVLYEMPLYSGLPKKRIYRLRLAVYNRLYKRVIGYRGFSASNAAGINKLASRIIGFEVTADSWRPFVKSLEHTVLEQTTAEDIKLLSANMDVIYGSLDMFVIRGKAEHIFGSASSSVTSHNIRTGHAISLKASQLIVQRLKQALI